MGSDKASLTYMSPLKLTTLKSKLKIELLETWVRLPSSSST